MIQTEYRAKVGDAEIIARGLGYLTARQVEATLWTGAGKTTDMVAGVMGCSESTAKTHIEAAMKRLDAVNRAHFIARAFTLGVLIVGTTGEKAARGVVECTWFVGAIALAWALYLTTISPPNDQLRPARRGRTQVVRVVRTRSRNNESLAIV